MTGPRWSAAALSQAAGVKGGSVRAYMQAGLILDAAGWRVRERYTLADAIRVALVAELLPQYGIAGAVLVTNHVAGAIRTAAANGADPATWLVVTVASGRAPIGEVIDRRELADRALAARLHRAQILDLGGLAAQLAGSLGRRPAQEVPA